jgi:hypothetical protein
MVDTETGAAKPYEPLGTRPHYYHRDGKPIIFDPQLGIPEVTQWATYFENANRQVRQTMTPYGERLSTVFLGMDHSFFGGPPLIFETMLFAPDPDRVRRRSIPDLWDAINGGKIDAERQAEFDRFKAHTEKHFPHDQLQLRYSTEEEAIETHIKLRLQCLIPPRWRRLLCYEIGGDSVWE